MTKRQHDFDEDETNPKILRDHFIDGLIDHTLQRYLREKLHTDNNVSFAEAEKFGGNCGIKSQDENLHMVNTKFKKAISKTVLVLVEFNDAFNTIRL